MTIFLGRPAYSLSVVLFSILLSSGLGSLSTTGADIGTRGPAIARLALRVGVLIAFGVAAPAIMQRFKGAATVTRVLIAVALLLPIGFCMGMAFPVGPT